MGVPTPAPGVGTFRTPLTWGHTPLTWGHPYTRGGAQAPVPSVRGRPGRAQRRR